MYEYLVSMVAWSVIGRRASVLGDRVPRGVSEASPPDSAEYTSRSIRRASSSSSYSTALHAVDAALVPVLAIS